MQKRGVVWSKYILSSSVELLAANQVEGYVLEPLRLCLNVCVPACEHACARDQPQLFYSLGIFGFFFLFLTIIVMLPIPLHPGFYPHSQPSRSTHSYTHPCVSVSSEIQRRHREKSTAPTLRKLGMRVRSRRRKGSVAVRWDVWNLRTQSRGQLTPVSPLIHQHTNKWRLPVARDLQHQHQLLHRPRSLKGL